MYERWRAALEQNFCGNVLKHAMQRGIWTPASASTMWLRKRRENFIDLADCRTFRKCITIQASFRLPSAPSLVAVQTYAVSFLKK